MQALAEDAVQVAGHVGQRAMALQHILNRSQAPLRARRRTCFSAGTEQAQAFGNKRYKNCQPNKKAILALRIP